MHQNKHATSKLQLSHSNSITCLVISFQNMSHAHQLAVKKRNLQRAQQRLIQQQQQRQARRALSEAAAVHLQHQQALQQQQQQQHQLPQEPEETPPHEEEQQITLEPPKLRQKEKNQHRKIMGFQKQPSTWRKVKSMGNLHPDIHDPDQIPLSQVASSTNSRRARSAPDLHQLSTITATDAQEAASTLLHVLDKESGEKLIISTLWRDNTVTRLSTSDVSTIVAISDLSESRSADETANSSFQSFPPSPEQLQELPQSPTTTPPVTTPTETSPPPYQTPKKSSNFQYHISKLNTGAQLLARDILCAPQPSSSSQAAANLTVPISPPSPIDKHKSCIICENSAGVTTYFSVPPEKRQELKCTCGRNKEVQPQQLATETSPIQPAPEVKLVKDSEPTQPEQPRRKTRFAGIPQGLWSKNHTFTPNKKK